MEPYLTKGPHVQACLPCGHIFGLKCIQSWLSKSSKFCPRCRAPCTVKKAVPLCSEQNEMIERLQQQLREREAQISRFEAAAQNPHLHVTAPADQPLAPLPNSANTRASETPPIAPQAPMEAIPHHESITSPPTSLLLSTDHVIPPIASSAAFVAEESQATCPTSQKAPAFFGLTSHRLPITDGQFLDAFPCFDLLIATSSISIFNAVPTTVIHPTRHGKLMETRSLIYGVVLYQNWTSPNDFLTHFVTLTSESITDLKVVSKGQGTDVKNFFMISTSSGTIIVAELLASPRGFSVNVIVEINLGYGWNPVTALEWDCENMDVIYAAISGQIVRMDLNAPSKTATSLSLSKGDNGGGKIFRVISLPSNASSLSRLLVGNPSGVHIVEWSYNNSKRKTESLIDGDEAYQIWHFLQRHPLHPGVLFAGCLKGNEQIFYSLKLADPVPERFELSPRTLFFRASAGNMTDSSACVFGYSDKDYLFLASSMEAVEIGSGFASPFGVKRAGLTKRKKVPILLPHHATELSNVLFWKLLGEGEGALIAAVSPRQIFFLMPY